MANEKASLDAGFCSPGRQKSLEGREAVCYPQPTMRTILLVPLVVLGWSATAWAADFIGPESCKSCHPAAYEAWKKSQHARALDSLTPQQRRDPRCMSCHSPDQKQHVAAVSCETCHGGGQFYHPAYVMKDPELARAVGLEDPGEKMCVKCHDANAPGLTPFDFATKLKAIDHWSAERAAKKAAKAAQKKPSAKKSR